MIKDNDKGGGGGEHKEGGRRGRRKRGREGQVDRGEGDQRQGGSPLQMIDINHLLSPPSLYHCYLYYYDDDQGIG